MTTSPTMQEELLAKVDEGRVHAEELIEQHGQLFDSTIESMIAPYRALKVAIEMHGAVPINYSFSDNTPTGYRCGCGRTFPCPTVTDIAKEMGI